MKFDFDKEIKKYEHVSKKDFYEKIREQIFKWAKRDGKKNKLLNTIMLAPDLFYVLWKLSLDNNVPIKQKAKAILGLTYFILPVDFMPESLLGPIGYLDDIVATVLILNSLLNDVPQELIEKYWLGEEKILPTIQKILKSANELIGSGIFDLLKKIFK
ncbi:hypothetical protein OSSY52_13110 [Tepiditoga spiralis]|uniref:DUF1232 domain-containing protein n=1 Tax=Tepiditoga spiralis TaxID=2108365 RepID=A0A7G1G3Y1_9BACT|nr:DUF1232 domain-containing protein [Tepiditoga spiralis]BBE31170.1 hypothetical protein OSSY52_13110 [Tepiditoga spiralis]